jgi:predicted acyl esterase
MASYEIPIQPVHWRFKAGHRLRLSISSGNAVALVCDAPAGTVTVATGEHGSSAEFLILPG